MEWFGKIETQEGAGASSEMLAAVERDELTAINSLVSIRNILIQSRLYLGLNTMELYR